MIRYLTLRIHTLWLNTFRNANYGIMRIDTDTLSRVYRIN